MGAGSWLQGPTCPTPQAAVTKNVNGGSIIAAQPQATERFFFSVEISTGIQCKKNMTDSH